MHFADLDLDPKLLNAIEKMGFDAKFKRTWDMYLAYCRGGFLNGQLEVSQYLLKVK